MIVSRSDAASGGPLLGTAQKGPWRVALDLWKARGSFRGFVEFAVIGAVVLSFLNARGLPSLGDLTRFATPSAGGATTSNPSSQLPSPPKFKNTELPLAPRPRDVAFDESYFDSAPEPSRTQLKQAMKAYTARDYQQAREYLNDTDLDDRVVALMKGVILIAVPGQPSFQAGLGFLRRAVELGEPKAMALLGVLTISGFPGLTRDVDAGRRLLDRAAAAGDASARRIIGEGYISGWMGSVDPGRAIQILRAASEGGDLKATFRLAEIYFAGLGMEKNHVEAERLLLKAAEGGHVEAQALLGTWRLTPYLSGVSDIPDDALQWLERAASKNEPHAMEYLGMFYVEYGKRTGLQDPPRGVELFRKCAETTTHPGCSFAYATALDLGVGGLRDPVRAYALYLRANAQAPSPKINARLDEIRKTLSSSDRARAVQLSAQLASRDGKGTP